MTASAQALDIQGHRGARGLAPENTLAAFARALSLGVTTLELDCAVTRDGVVVVSHDRALNPDLTRTPDGKWLAGPGPRIRELTYGELQRYDVGRLRPDTTYASRFPDQQPVDGARIPRLADVFALVKRSGNGVVRFNIETKISPLAPEETTGPEDFARRLMSAVRAARMDERTAIQSFDWRTLAIIQKEAPTIATVYLTAEQDFMNNIESGRPSSAWTAGLHVSQFGGSIPRLVKAAGGAAWSPYYRELTREKLREAHALGLKVVPWTVNEPADMKRLIEWRVDGIISDRPDILRKVAAETGIPLPQPTPVAP
jgi:glycerophosphoryl diester phosphodiesterase